MSCREKNISDPETDRKEKEPWPETEFPFDDLPCSIWECQSQEQGNQSRTPRWVAETHPSETSLPPARVSISRELESEAGARDPQSGAWLRDDGIKQCLAC